MINKNLINKVLNSFDFTFNEVKGVLHIELPRVREYAGYINVTSRTVEISYGKYRAMFYKV